MKHSPKINSLKNTFCIFEEVDPNILSNTTENFKSTSGSKYFYCANGIYRSSNHWGKLGTAKWRLNEYGLSLTKTKVGFAKYEDFHHDNDTELLYFLAWNKTTNTINYFHKNLPYYDQKAILRNSKDTQKRLKNARNILNLTNWASYFNEPIDPLREKIITDLIYTNLPLNLIKQKYL